MESISTGTLIIACIDEVLALYGESQMDLQDFVGKNDKSFPNFADIAMKKLKVIMNDMDRLLEMAKNALNIEKLLGICGMIKLMPTLTPQQVKDFDLVVICSKVFVELLKSDDERLVINSLSVLR